MNRSLKGFSAGFGAGALLCAGAAVAHFRHVSTAPGGQTTIAKITCQDNANRSGIFIDRPSPTEDILALYEGDTESVMLDLQAGRRPGLNPVRIETGLSFQEAVQETAFFCSTEEYVQPPKTLHPQQYVSSEATPGF